MRWGLLSVGVVVALYTGALLALVLASLPEPHIGLRCLLSVPRC